MYIEHKVYSFLSIFYSVSFAEICYLKLFKIGFIFSTLGAQSTNFLFNSKNRNGKNFQFKKNVNKFLFGNIRNDTIVCKFIKFT